MAEGGEYVIPEEKIVESRKASGNNGLVLYSYHHCFFSQKVIMALYEKKIPFTTKLVDITKQEQYHVWYLKINPKGEVPVLKDGIKYIPDSERILEYLEDNFSNGEHARLIPIDQGPEIRQKVIKFYEEINSIPAHFITVGPLFHSEFCSNFRYPFVIPLVRTFLRESEKMGNRMLRDEFLKNPQYAGMLLEKAEAHHQRQLLVRNKKKYLQVLQQIDSLLDKIENELSARDENQSEWWLCTDRFTLVDISFTVLLDRLSRVGLENHFWGKGQRPNIDKYYKRVQRRDSYKKTMPTFMTDLSIIIRDRAPLILGVSLLTVLTVVVGRFFYFKK